ncbi:hypothetical protein [Hoeflea sp.]|uniref:hypothetical protein n=1 Tax=Hoeflea sp. TaxID=1940281 RepID=UPI003A8CD661
MEFTSRLAYIGGMPTHELFTEAYYGAGISNYPSAAFIFVPEVALKFCTALRVDDRAAMQNIPDTYFYPFAKLRDR